MMKLFIPTVLRANNQITLSQIPEEMRKDVYLLVQAWEADQYKHHKVKLHVLPDSPEFHYSNRLCLPNTRNYLYRLHPNEKIGMLDDDVVFIRRNKKYFTDENGNKFEADMETSNRVCTPDDMREMFGLIESLLDKNTLVGCDYAVFPPGGGILGENAPVFTASFLNTAKLQYIVNHPKARILEEITVGEDMTLNALIFLLGHTTCKLKDFCFRNESVRIKDMQSAVWDRIDEEKYDRTIALWESVFPGCVRYDPDKLGYKNRPELKIDFRKVKKLTKVLEERRLVLS